MDRKIQNALYTIQQQLLILENCYESRRPETKEMSTQTVHSIAPGSSGPLSLLLPPSSLEKNEKFAVSSPLLSSPSSSPQVRLCDAEITSTSPSPSAAELPVKMDFVEEDPQQVCHQAYPKKDLSTILIKTECSQETTVEEDGTVYAVLGEPVRRVIKPIKEEPEEPEPVIDTTDIPRVNRKRPLDEEPPSKPDCAPAPEPRLPKNGARIGRPTGTVKLRRPAPDDVSDEEEDEDEGEERICRWKACGEQFKTQRKFMKHVVAHMKEDGEYRVWKCLWEGCSRSKPFDEFYKLCYHVRTHTKYKPYVCTEPGCNKACSNSENLKVHRRTHSGEKPFECPSCDKKFNNRSDQARHVKQVHSDEKKYICGVESCGKSYTDRSSLRKHMRNHHPGYSKNS